MVGFVNVLKLDGFSILPVDTDIFNRVQGKSYRSDCTVPVDDLRYLTLLHKDAEGSTLQGEMICHASIAKSLLDIFQALYRESYPVERVRLVDDYDADDEASMEDNNSSCFNFRFISHTRRVSKHGLGLAVDINPRYNPYWKKMDGKEIIEPASARPYLDRTLDFPYKIERNDLCCRLFAAHGFQWGGDWEDRKDYQHFELRNCQFLGADIRELD